MEMVKIQKGKMADNVNCQSIQYRNNDDDDDVDDDDRSFVKDSIPIGFPDCFVQSVPV